VRLGAGPAAAVGEVARAAAPDGWASGPASYAPRGHASAPARLAVGRGTPALPARIRSKGQDPAADRVWALLSTRASAGAAVASCALRLRTEGTDRDRKGWGPGPVAARRTDPAHLDGLLGLAALG